MTPISTIFRQQVRTVRMPDTKTTPWGYLLIFFLLIKALAMFLVISWDGIGLGPDEAQYWTWSQTPDFGYYSKPPGIAWLIWLGTKLFGQTEWGVRSMSVVLSILQGLMIYRLALATDLQPRTSFWTAIFMAFSPLGIAGSFFAITDVGFLLCWTGACALLAEALKENRAPHPLRLAAWMIGGVLFKWPMYLFWLIALCCRQWYFPQQTIKRFASGVLTSLIGLLPSLWWNWSHDWSTFRHVSATLQGGSSHRAGGNFWEFLGSQALLVSPILFILLLFALWQWFRQKNKLSPPLFFCGFTTCVTLSLAMCLSLLQKMQGNWVVFAYPTAFVIIGWYVFQSNAAKLLWAKIGLGLSVVCTLLLIYLPFSTNTKLGPFIPAHRDNPFKHNIGWNELKLVLAKHGYKADKHFLVSDKYQTSSLLSFYNLGQKRAYFLNIHGVRNNQFTYWPSLQQNEKDQTGYFIWVENAPHLERHWKDKSRFYQEELKKYFEEVEWIGLEPLISQSSNVVKGALIFRCKNCLPVVIDKPSLY